MFNKSSCRSTPWCKVELSYCRVHMSILTGWLVTISLASPMAALMALLHKGVNACII